MIFGHACIKYFGLLLPTVKNFESNKTEYSKILTINFDDYYRLSIKIKIA